MNNQLKTILKNIINEKNGIYKKAKGACFKNGCFCMVGAIVNEYCYLNNEDYIHYPYHHEVLKKLSAKGGYFDEIVNRNDGSRHINKSPRKTIVERNRMNIKEKMARIANDIEESLKEAIKRLERGF